MEHLQYAWDVMKANMVPWIIFGIVFGCVISFTFGLGVFLLPNAVRATRKAIASNAAPEIGELFLFDTIADDAIVMVGQGVANMAGALLCGIGSLATGPMFLFAPYVVSEGSYDGVSSLKATFEHGKSNIVPNLIQMVVISLALSALTMFTLGIGSLFASPIALIAFEHYYQEQRSNLLASAQTAQIPTKG